MWTNELIVPEMDIYSLSIEPYWTYLYAKFQMLPVSISNSIRRLNDCESSKKRVSYLILYGLIHYDFRNFVYLLIYLFVVFVFLSLCVTMSI